MLEFLKKFFKKVPDEIFTGLIFPSQEEIEKLTKFDEIVASANEVKWQPLDLAKLPTYTVRNQNGASSCVAHTLAMMCSILYFLRTGTWVDFSARWFYFWRSNKPGLGMVGTDAFKIGSVKGALPEALLASDELSEADMNNPKLFEWFGLIAEIFKLDTKFVLLPIGDIETAASVIQTTGKPLMVWFRFGPGEWVSVPKLSSISIPYHHSVTAIPPRNPGDMAFGMYEGEKAIVIQDSWGVVDNTFAGKRIIKESFFKVRNTFVGYPFRFKFDITDKAVYTGSIISFQECMRSIGLFPSNVSYIESFGPITKRAVLAYQEQKGLPKTGVIDMPTRAKLLIEFN